MRLRLTRQCRQPHSLDLINRAPAVREPEDVDEARPRLDLDQPEMVEQLQRWRYRFPRDVVISSTKMSTAFATLGAGRELRGPTNWFLP